ncbi:hypothetical protein BUL40_11430 [Croceivirga radicis]|uniref:Adhesin domain-containing protein n=1 Tax=Croceivirga radicis TaxID=1929488 RepID=A0A1V6LQ93_9FLAO|nr:hypothetical protein [Croceivirga radicis]OQD42370.1 hypothetical protein BUL40_11430 [Croceivirga radicis]
MNSQLLFKTCTALLFCWSLQAQESKTYTETFSVGEQTELELNTSYTDIEFESWNKDKVEITAIVTLEGATAEEAEDYFNSEPFTIMGNSKRIEINSKSGNSWNFVTRHTDDDFHIDVEPLFLDLEIPDLPEVAAIVATVPEMPIPPAPPMPPMPEKSFDYGKFKAEGEKYLKEWSKEFQKSFDKEYEKKMEDWGKKVEEQAKKWEEKHAKAIEKRAEAMEKRAEAIEERQEEIEKKVEQRAKMIEEQQERRQEAMEKRMVIRNQRFGNGDDTNIFFYSNDGNTKKYKVKKTLKIKLPKSVKLKMNVKHGEVKLADLTKNLQANLRYASLLANTIEGSNTFIDASYTPVSVVNWNVGKLQTNYSDKVQLATVKELGLSLNSSKVTIGSLDSKAHVTNNLGDLNIAQLGIGFKTLDVTVQNGELLCKLPKDAVSVYINGTQSDIEYPKVLTMERTKNFNTTVCKGYKNSDSSGKSININAKYSTIVLD